MTAALLPVAGIHGVPRSGTTWLGQLFNSHPAVRYCYQPFFAHAFRGRADLSTGAPDLRGLFRDMLACDDAFVNQTGDARLSPRTPTFDKQTPDRLLYKEVRFHHLLPHFLRTLPEFKGIGVVRDPRFVLASWFQAPREFDPAWSRAAEWREAPLKNRGLDENWYGFTRWVALANLFLELERAWPGRFTLVRYEWLVAEPQDAMQALFESCGLDMHPQTLAFIRESSTEGDDDPYGVYRSGGADRVRAARHCLEPDIAAAIERELAGTPLERFMQVDPK